MKKVFSTLGKSLVAVAAALFSAVLGETDASAQYSEVYRQGADFYSEGQMLTSEQLTTLLGSVDGVSFSDVEKYRKGFKTGKGLLIGFGSLTGAGLITLGVGATGLLLEGVAFGIGVAFIGPWAAAAGEDVDWDYDVSRKYGGVAVAGMYATCFGILGLAAGTTVFCVYKKKLNRVADAFNERENVQLTFGAQKHGAGLALVF